MADNAQIIWNYFKSKGFTDCGVAGLMGNLYAESGLIPTNLQNSFQNKLGMTDSQYTSAVDNGTYNNFIKDKAGYGLAQWTYWSRKQNLLQFCQSRNKSIGDLNTQLDFLYQELTKDLVKREITIKTYLRYTLNTKFTTILSYDNLPFIFAGRNAYEQKEIVFNFPDDKQEVMVFDELGLANK